MKRLIFSMSCFCLLLVLMSLRSAAQTGTFIQAEIGTGKCNDAFETSSAWYYTDFVTHRLGASNASIAIGKRFRKWELSAGISFLTSGYNESYITGDFAPVFISETYHFSHIMVPVTMSRELRLHKQFFFRPALGIALAYDITDLNRTTTESVSSGPANSVKSTSESTSLWSTAKATFGFRLNSHLAIIAVPEAHYMITSLSQTPYDGRLQNIACTFNAGIVADLHEAKR